VWAIGRQFLGPHRNGTVPDDAFVKEWLGGELGKVWSVTIGEGFSGISVAGDRIFTMDSDGKDEFVLSLSANDGKELWRIHAGLSPRDVYGGYGPRVTPSVANEKLYTVTAQGELWALKADSGELVWKRQLQTDLGWRPPAEGTSCSPLVQDGRIFLIIGGADGKAVASFHAKSGKTLWTSQDDRPSYSSAVYGNYEEYQQVLFLTGSNLFAVDALQGKSLWKYSWPTYDFVNVTTPILVPPDRVFISSGYDQGAALLQIGKNKDGLFVKEVWRNREMKNHFNNSVYFDGAFFGFDNAILKAIDAATGQTLWREKGFGTGSLILAGSYLVILSDSGEIACAKADQKSLKIEKRQKVLQGKTWTPPSLSNGFIFLRNQQEAICLKPQSRKD
jgi:outer membrane protein assembly factor BamB